MKLLFANNAGSTLSAPITNSQTTIPLAAGTGALFPVPGAGQYFSVTVVDQGTGLLREIMWCTGNASDVLTVIRAQEGTTAKAYAFGDKVANLWTAGQAAKMAQDPSDFLGGVSAVQVYAGNPNGHIAGNAAVVATSAPSAVWDTVNNILWVCTSTGTVSTAVWIAPQSINGTIYAGTSTGTANAQVLTPAVPVPSYVVGLSLAFLVGAGLTNTGALTINVSGLGAKNVYKESPTGPIPLTGGEVVAANLVSARYDGTQFQLTSTELGTAALANASSNTGTVAAVSGTITSGHVPVFSDPFGTLIDGGPANAASAPTMISSATNVTKGTFNINSAGGAFTITINPTPALNDCIDLTDIFNNCPVNNVTLDATPKNFVVNGLTGTTFVWNVPYERFVFTYNGTSWGVF